MLSAVAILIERTKTHPEEFANGYSSDYGKWDDVIKEFCLCMTAEEKDALTAAMTNARREMFNEAVMKRLAGSDKKNDLSEDLLMGMANKLPSKRPSNILTSAQITKDALKIIEGEFDKEYSRFTKEYDINTDSYYLKEKK
jgi:translation elongation factor EF-G